VNLPVARLEHRYVAKYGSNGDVCGSRLEIKIRDVWMWCFIMQYIKAKCRADGAVGLACVTDSTPGAHSMSARFLFGTESFLVLWKVKKTNLWSSETCQSV